MISSFTKNICGAGFIHFFCGNDVEKCFNHQVEEEDEATSKAVNDDDSEEVPGLQSLWLHLPFMLALC